MIHLIGPGGAGKTTTGALLADRLGVPFVDLDAQFMATVPGGIDGWLNEHSYLSYAARNVQLYVDLCAHLKGGEVVALSSGFMTYPADVHPAYSAIHREVSASATTFVLLPTFDFEACVAEIVRRQMTRNGTRSAMQEEEVIRERFWVYAGLPARKVETLRSCDAVVDELVRALSGSLGATPVPPGVTRGRFGDGWGWTDRHRASLRAIGPTRHEGRDDEAIREAIGAIGPPPLRGRRCAKPMLATG
jgi:shikimate kinase